MDDGASDDLEAALRNLAAFSKVSNDQHLYCDLVSAYGRGIEDIRWLLLARWSTSGERAMCAPCVKELSTGRAGEASAIHFHHSFYTNIAVQSQ
jgi:hypothetical protein